MKHPHSSILPYWLIASSGIVFMSFALQGATAPSETPVIGRSEVLLQEEKVLESSIQALVETDPLFAPSDTVEVKAQGRDIVLNGTVSDMVTKQAATRNALQAGADTVVNEIQIASLPSELRESEYATTFSLDRNGHFSRFYGWSDPSAPLLPGESGR